MTSCAICSKTSEGLINGKHLCKHHLVLVRKKQISAYVKSKRQGKLIMKLMIASLIAFAFSLGMLTNHLLNL